jgi:ABC-2 type transport system permease protein
MRSASLFWKSLLENLRDWKMLILILTFGPFFVVLIYFYSWEAERSPHRVIVVSHDQGATGTDGGFLQGGEELVRQMTAVRDPDGDQTLELLRESDLETALERLENRLADLVVEIPPDFSRVLLAYRAGERPDPAVVTTYGDPANTQYIMAAVWSDMITYEYAAATAGLSSPLELRAESVSGVESLTEFELYVPALLALALIMLMFTAAASIIKEKDKGTLVRLRLSNMRVSEWLVAVSVTQVIIGLLALALTYATAAALGYKSAGSWLAVLVVGLLSTLSIVAISLIVAAFLRTIFDLLTIGCFPFFVLMFFSGGMFPLPPLQVCTVGGRPLHINDLLPTTHTITALDKILNRGAHLNDLLFELGAITVLTLLLYVLGTLIITRRHMRPAA